MIGESPTCVRWLPPIPPPLVQPVLILFDHGAPKGLIRALHGHTVDTGQAKGWDTLSNGALLTAAEEAGGSSCWSRPTVESATNRTSECTASPSSF